MSFPAPTSTTVEPEWTRLARRHGLAALGCVATLAVFMPWAKVLGMGFTPIEGYEDAWPLLFAGIAAAVAGHLAVLGANENIRLLGRIVGILGFVVVGLWASDFVASAVADEALGYLTIWPYVAVGATAAGGVWIVRLFCSGGGIWQNFSRGLMHVTVTPITNVLRSLAQRLKF